jgi:hypothetical protein
MGIAVTRVAEGLDKACEEPDETDGEHNPLDNFQVCKVKDADDQQHKLDDCHHAAYASMMVNQRRGKHRCDEGNEQQLGAIGFKRGT